MGKKNKGNRDLRLEVWKESIKRIPKTRKVRMKPDNYGPGSKGYHEKANPDGGKVDLYAYGGKKSKSQKFNDLMSGRYGKKDKDGEKTRKEWRNVAKEIGVNLNSESDVAQMIDYVMGMGRQKEKPEETVNSPTEAPSTFTPSDAHQEARSDFEAKQDNPIPRMSDQPGLAGGTSDPMVDAIRHGDDLNDWYQRETERQKAGAKLGAYEIGERTRFNASRFVGKMPELGDVGKLVENYSKDFK